MRSKAWLGSSWSVWGSPESASETLSASSLAASQGRRCAMRSFCPLCLPWLFTLSRDPVLLRLAALVRSPWVHFSFRGASPVPQPFCSARGFCSACVTDPSFPIPIGLVCFFNSEERLTCQDRALPFRVSPRCLSRTLVPPPAPLQEPVFRHHSRQGQRAAFPSDNFGWVSREVGCCPRHHLEHDGRGPSPRKAWRRPFLTITRA